MVVSDPYGSLNPRRRIGARSRRLPAGSALGRVQDLLARWGCHPSSGSAPHQLRWWPAPALAIARALAADPSVIVLDEPLSALAPRSGAGGQLLVELARDLGMAMSLFARSGHSAPRGHRTAVMYLADRRDRRASELWHTPRIVYPGVIVRSASGTARQLPEQLAGEIFRTRLIRPWARFSALSVRPLTGVGRIAAAGRGRGQARGGLWLHTDEQRRCAGA